MSIATFEINSLAQAIRDGHSNDRSTYNAIASLSAYIASRLTQSVMDAENKGKGAESALDMKRFNAIWSAYLQRYAAQGGTVWEGTDEKLDTIRATRGDRRIAMAKEYIEKKPKGSRLVASLATRKTYVRRLVKDTLENHAGIFRDILAMAQSGEDADMLAGLWQAHVEHWYGPTLSALCNALPGNTTPRADKTELEKVMDRAKNWDLATLEEITIALVKRRDDLRDDVAGLDGMGSFEIEHVATPSTDTTTGKVIKQLTHKAA